LPVGVTILELAASGAWIAGEAGRHLRTSCTTVLAAPAHLRAGV